MSKFTVAFETDNEAFAENFEREAERILRDVASRVAHGEIAGTIRDINGNRVGSFDYVV